MSSHPKAADPAAIIDVDVDAEILALKARITEARGEMQRLQRLADKARASGRLAEANRLAAQAHGAEIAMHQADEAYLEGRKKLLVDEHSRADAILGALDEQCRSATEGAVSAFASAWQAVAEYVAARGKLVSASKRLNHTSNRYGLRLVGDGSAEFKLPHGVRSAPEIPVVFRAMVDHFLMRIEQGVQAAEMNGVSFATRGRATFPPGKP
jgi:hypothetical protein